MAPVFYLIVAFSNHIENYDFANGLLLTQYIVQFKGHVFWVELTSSMCSFGLNHNEPKVQVFEFPSADSFLKSKTFVGSPQFFGARRTF
ncbi:hypothetical protein [Acidiluteibacter ferrifornacis]|uniref:hypothetical protein n=1 Tax=Acidiluteibacter ferrifornacis TaxID=2692424 RepID=UPI001A9584D3|nr:hypothetical protein [Acidiluteibacter ferrifornacis]